jgi:hypothetical protein
MIPRTWRLKMFNWLGAGYISVNRDEECVPSISIDRDDHMPDMSKAIKFAVLPARGGCVMETRTYDRKEREWDVISHVIPDGADVAKEVGDIVAMELLRR